MSPLVLLGRRTRAFRILLLLIFAVMILRLVAVQEFSHQQYASLSRAELTQTVTIPALRGGIYDRNGEVLAESVTKQTVVADPFLIKHPGTVAAALAPVLGVSRSLLRSEMTEHSGFVYLARRVPSAVATKVTSLNLTGINLIPEAQLVQPAGQLALPVIGTVGSGDTGLSGLEYQYQSLLAGSAGSKSVLESPNGVAIPGTIGASTTGAKAGTGIELTIDESLQYVAEQALAAEVVASKAQGGTAVVMDVKTGDILAMADIQATPAGSNTPAGSTAGTSALPSANPATSPSSSGPTLTAQANTLPAGAQEAPANRAVTQVYEPGSVFKLVTFSAALQHGIITPNQVFTVPGALPLGGYIFHDAESHGTESLTASQILAQSSNIGTIEISQALGEKGLLAQIGNLGFGHPTGLHFPGASPGLILGPSQWTGSSIGSTPIGQDDAVSPLQLLDAYNAVANGGVMVQPRLVQATVAPDGSVSALSPSPTRRVIAAATDAQLIPMFEGVVADSNGTGTLGAINGYTVAGKTGTSNIPSPHHPGYTPGAFYATFVGFAPATRPVLSAVVMLQHPTPVYGGAVAAPVFSAIMKYALQHYGIPTDTVVRPSTSNGAIGGPVTLPSNPLQGA